MEQRKVRMVAGAVTVAGLIVVAAGVVWWAGGTHTVFPHLLYLPVVVAALLAGSRPAGLAAVAAGLAVGPGMPLDVAAGTFQSTSNWLIRTGFFLAVGLLVGEGRRRLLALSETRQRFVSAISHEVRTPLAAMLGFSQLLAERGGQFTEEERTEFARLIHHEVTDLSEIVDGYIIAARLDDSALVIDPQPVDLHQAVIQTIDRLPEAVRHNRIQITAASKPVEAWVDPMRLRQILRALCANLLAYGGDHITISTHQERDEAVITISHYGPTIPRHLIDDAVASPNPDTEDTRPRPVGMGLSVPVRLAQLMEGSLTHRARPDGDSFDVRLPTTPHPTGLAALRRTARL